MDFEVKTEILPLSPEDKKLLRKRGAASFMGFAVMLVFIYFFLTKLILPTLEENSFMTYAIMVFFVTVLVIIGINFFKSISSKEKLVQTGFITNKRVKKSVSHLEKTTASSRVTMTYYITLGEEEFVVPTNYYNQVNKGDHVQVEKTIKNKEVFKIEILKPEENLFVASELSQRLAPPKTRPFKGEDKKIVGVAFLKSFVLRGIVLGGMLYLLSMVLFFLLVVNVELTDGSEYIIYSIRVIVLVFWLRLNKRTIDIFLDWNGGEKKIGQEYVSDCYCLNTAGNTRKINSYYVKTKTGFNFLVEEDLGKNLVSGDVVYVSYSPRAKVILEVTNS